MLEKRSGGTGIGWRAGDSPDYCMRRELGMHTCLRSPPFASRSTVSMAVGPVLEAVFLAGEVFVVVPHDTAGAIIGKAGATVRREQARTWARTHTVVQ